MTLIIADMRVVGGTWEGVKVVGGAGVRGEAPARGSGAEPPDCHGRRGETHVEHNGVREKQLQWRSRRSKKDRPDVFHFALKCFMNKFCHEMRHDL